MASNVKTHDELKQIFRKMAMSILELPADDNKSIRFPWGSTVKTGSAPGFAREQDVAFVYVLPVDGGMNQCRDISFLNEGFEKLTYVDEHTDILGVRFVCYGPSAFDWARRLRDGVSHPHIKEYLQRNDIALVHPVPAPIPAPEVKDGDWWNRFDIGFQFNEYVRIEVPDSIAALEKADINFVTESCAAEPVAYSSEMKLAELKRIAVVEYGCDAPSISAMTRKDNVIAAIDRAVAGKEDEDHGDTAS